MDSTSVHCLDCGGYVVKVLRAKYRVWSERASVAHPRLEPCGCAKPVLFMPRRSTRAKHEIAPVG